MVQRQKLVQSKLFQPLQDTLAGKPYDCLGVEGPGDNDDEGGSHLEAIWLEIISLVTVQLEINQLEFIHIEVVQLQVIWYELVHLEAVYVEETQ